MPNQSLGSTIVQCVIRDKHGKTIQLGKVVDSGYLLPYFPDCLDALIKFPDVQARYDDVIICGYPKCGTHWIWEIAGMLHASSAEYLPSIKESVMLEAMPLASLPSMTSPRILNSHLPLELLPPDFVKKRSRLVLLLRHPKDVVVSLFHHVLNLEPMYGYTGSWAGFLDLFLRGQVEYGNFFEYLQQWENNMAANPDVPVHVIHYEDMKHKPVEQIARLARFLGVNDDNSDLHREIAERTTFARMKIGKAEMDDEAELAYWKDGQPMVYRKGEVNDWKNWFLVRQSDCFDAIVKRDTAGLRVTLPKTDD